MSVAFRPPAHIPAVSKDEVVKFARCASLEISPHDECLLPVLANQLPAGTLLYVAHPPKAALEDVVRVAITAESLGFRASPHIVARRLARERDLRFALAELADAGVEQILLVAGDVERPVGPFASTLDVLDCGMLGTAGIARVGFAAHPEGHKVIGPARLLEALKRKQAFADRTGIRVHLVTQFGFNPRAVGAWGAHLAVWGIRLPIRVGIAGPAPLPKLIRSAMQCGIGASMGLLVRNLSAMSQLARAAVGPDELLTGLVRDGVHHNAQVLGPHFFAFGGTVATATWLRAILEGRFNLAEGDKFALLA